MMTSRYTIIVKLCEVDILRLTASCNITHGQFPWEDIKYVDNINRRTFCAIVFILFGWE